MQELLYKNTNLKQSSSHTHYFEIGGKMEAMGGKVASLLVLGALMLRESSPLPSLNKTLKEKVKKREKEIVKG